MSLSMQSYNSRRAGGYLDERIGEDRKDTVMSKEQKQENRCRYGRFFEEKEARVAAAGTKKGKWRQQRGAGKIKTL